MAEATFAGSSLPALPLGLLLQAGDEFVDLDEGQLPQALEVIERVVALAPEYVGITLFTVGVWSAAQIAAGA